MIDLVVFDVEYKRVRDPESELGVLVGIHIHFESLKVNQQQFRTLFDHHLTCSHLLRVAGFTEKLVTVIQELFSAKFLEAVGQRYVLLNVN